MGDFSIQCVPLDRKKASESLSYEVEYPNAEDRAKFFVQLLETAVNISEQKYSENTKPVFLPELPKAPIVERERSEAQLQAQFEEEQHSLRRMRMCLREVCNRLLREKSFSVFHYPVTEEDAPDYHTLIRTPMDISTLLHRTDHGQYMTRSAFLQDLELIPLSAKAYHKDDYNGARIVSKACALRDAAHVMLSQIDKDLVTQCEAILSRGGPLRLDAKLSGTEMAGSFVPPVGQPSNANTRASARLRGAQPEIGVSESEEVHIRRSRRSSEGGIGGDTEVVFSQTRSTSSIDLNIDLAEKTTEDPISPMVHMEVDGPKDLPTPENADNDNEQKKNAMSVTTNDDFVPTPSSPDLGGKDQMELRCEQSPIFDPDHPMAAVSASYVEKLKKRFVKRTKGLGVSDLELIHAKVCQDVRIECVNKSRTWVIKLFKKFIAELNSRESKGLNGKLALHNA
ncbi:hypothetical protein L7F22_068931 [Adiantum nelumboides]|nr:hypothetical protein [Adiantum nelumboides]